MQSRYVEQMSIVKLLLVPVIFCTKWTYMWSISASRYRCSICALQEWQARIVQLWRSVHTYMYMKLLDRISGRTFSCLCCATAIHVHERTWFFSTTLTASVVPSSASSHAHAHVGWDRLTKKFTEAYTDAWHVQADQNQKLAIHRRRQRSNMAAKGTFHRGHLMGSLRITPIIIIISNRDLELTRNNLCVLIKGMSATGLKIYCACMR